MVTSNLAAYYEELRQGALGGQPRGTAWGLVVLRTRGMASWVRSAQEHALPREEKTSHVSSLPTGDEIVRVLAGMVWP